MVRRCLLVALAAACALVLSPVAAQAAGRTQTLHVFDKVVSVKITHADGTVVTHPPFADPQPGDVLDANSLDYRGNHKHHDKKWFASSHVRCVFGTAGGPPTCESHIAIGGSLLVFTGDPGTLTNGTGIYQGATGRVLSNKTIGDGNDSDVVIRIHLHA